MPRDDILAQNPMAQQLVLINQRVITVDGQNADSYAFTSARNEKPFTKHQPGLTMQRFYCEMICQSVHQARKIAKRMSGLCTYMLAYQSGKQVKMEGNHHTTVDVTVDISNMQVVSNTRVHEMTSGQGQAMIKQYRSYLSKLYKSQTNNICWLMLVGKDFPRLTTQATQAQAMAPMVPKQYSQAWIYGKLVDHAGTISLSNLDAVELNAKIYNLLASIA